MTEQIPGIYDPCGIVEVESSPLAHRPDTENGLRLAVLSNTKWNAAKLLRATVRALTEQGLTFAAVQTRSSTASPPTTTSPSPRSVTAGRAARRA
jgi:hypothetical protein